MVRLRPSGRADGEGSERSLDVDKQLGFSALHSPHRVRVGKLRSGGDAHEHLFFSAALKYLHLNRYCCFGLGSCRRDEEPSVWWSWGSDAAGFQGSERRRRRGHEIDI